MRIKRKILFRRLKTLSLRSKVAIGVVLPLLIILSAFTFFEYKRQKAILLNNLSIIASQAGQTIETTLRHGMFESDFEGIQEYLDTIGKDGALELLYILNTDGEVIFAPNNQGVGLHLNNNHPDCQPCHKLPVEDRPSSIVVTNANGQQVFRSMQPIENRQECMLCHDPTEKLRGLLLTDISIGPFESGLVAFLRENLFWWLGTILTTGLVAYFLINRFVLYRLEKLVAVIGDFAHGQMPHTVLETQTDEIGQLAKSFVTMAQEVQKRYEENRVLSQQIQTQSEQRGELLTRLITAQEDERKRLARNLHDDLGQTLSGLALRSEALEQYIHSDPVSALNQLDHIKSIITDATDKMYDLIISLRPSILDDLGLVPALRDHAERVLKNTNIQFEFDVHNLSIRLTPEIEVTLFRIYQEALNNVVRHSHANQVLMMLSCDNGVFEGEITDNGMGFKLGDISKSGEIPGSYGLLGMKERVTQCGGTLTIDSTLGVGTTIQLRIPLEEPACGE